MLEDEGIIQSHAGAKSYVVLDEAKVEEIREELAENDIGAMISALKQSGLTREEGLELIGRLWKE